MEYYLFTGFLYCMGIALMQMLLANMNLSHSNRFVQALVILFWFVITPFVILSVALESED